ncbi:MAG: PQQ-binding-like beta-propeller repeat protein, partial [Rhodanobacter sp.]
MKAGVMKQAWLIALTTTLVALAGCHSFKKENIQPPTPLAKDFKPTVQASTLWTARVGGGAGDSGVRLRPTVVDGVLYASSTDGTLAAFDAASGK